MPPELEDTYPLLAAGVLGTLGAGLWGEIHTEGCPDVSIIALEKSPSISLHHTRTGGYITWILCDRVWVRNQH